MVKKRVVRKKPKTNKYITFVKKMKRQYPNSSLQAIQSEWRKMKGGAVRNVRGKRGGANPKGALAALLSGLNANITVK